MSTSTSPWVQFRAKFLPLGDYFALVAPKLIPWIYGKYSKLEDLKVLRCSPDLLNNVKIGQGQLQLIMEQILFYHNIWGLQTFWSSDLNDTFWSSDLNDE